MPVHTLSMILNAFLPQVFGYKPYTVISGSMEPQYQDVYKRQRLRTRALLKTEIPALLIRKATTLSEQ